MITLGKVGWVLKASISVSPALTLSCLSPGLTFLEGPFLNYSETCSDVFWMLLVIRTNSTCSKAEMFSEFPTHVKGVSLFSYPQIQWTEFIACHLRVIVPLWALGNHFIMWSTYFSLSSLYSKAPNLGHCSLNLDFFFWNLTHFWSIILWVMGFQTTIKCPQVVKKRK